MADVWLENKICQIAAQQSQIAAQQSQIAAQQSQIAAQQRALWNRGNVGTLRHISIVTLSCFICFFFA